MVYELLVSCDVRSHTHQVDADTLWTLSADCTHHPQGDKRDHKHVDLEQRLRRLVTVLTFKTKTRLPLKGVDE